LKYAFDDLVKVFHRRHPDIKISVTYGSSGSFFAQLENRAPFDLFLSADTAYPRLLVDKGLAADKSFFVYAVGHLVVWVRKDSPLDVKKLGLKALLEPAVETIAIANPRHAPYGRAAGEALRRAGLYDRVKGRMLLGKNVAQAAQFVDQGGASVGLISLSQAVAPPLRHKGRYYRLPAAAYPRIEQGGVILSWAKDRGAADTLRRFLVGARGRAVLRRYGFSFPRK
jgi:molybdate transport system substrate-binding protein